MRGEGVVTVTLQLVFVFWPSCKSKVEKAFVGWKINWHLGGFKKQIGRAIDSCLLSVSVRFRHTRPPRPSWIYIHFIKILLVGSLSSAIFLVFWCCSRFIKIKTYLGCVQKLLSFFQCFLNPFFLQGSPAKMARFLFKKITVF